MLPARHDDDNDILNIYGLVWFGLVLFYGISNIVGYLMPSYLYTYVLNIYDLL